MTFGDSSRLWRVARVGHARRTATLRPCCAARIEIPRACRRIGVPPLIGVNDVVTTDEDPIAAYLNLVGKESPLRNARKKMLEHLGAAFLPITEGACAGMNMMSSVTQPTDYLLVFFHRANWAAFFASSGCVLDVSAHTMKFEALACKRTLDEHHNRGGS